MVGANPDLPETARHLVSLIGYPATLELLKAKGGRTVVFSKGKRADGQAQYEAVAEVAGQEAADILADHYDGIPVYLPRCTKALRAERDKRIRDEFDSGTKTASARAVVAAIAENYDMSDRNVWKIVNGS